MTIHVPHTATDELGDLPDLANDNDVAVATFHHGSLVPTTPLIGELYSDTVNGMMRQRSESSTWVNLWPLLLSRMERTVTRQFWSIGSSTPGLGPGNVAPPSANAIACSLTTLNHETLGIRDSRVLVFGERSDLPIHNNYAVSIPVCHNSSNWSGSIGNVVETFLSIPRLGGVFGGSFNGYPAIETFEAIT